jgi:hypothetical protein
MRTLHLTGLAFAVATGFALPLAGSAEAAMTGALPATQVLPVEDAQFFFLGHNFCWYDGGWQGPGWYWCGYAWNNGQGWGGGDGWHGWSRNQWHGHRGPVGHAPQHHAPVNNMVRPTPHHAPHNNVVRQPSHHAPMNNVVRRPQFHGAASHVGGHGPARSHGGGGANWQKNK